MASGPLTARGPNAVAIGVRDAGGQPVDGARVRIAPGMTSMVMMAPAVNAVAQGDGRYLAHPVFGMAGAWRLDVTLAVPGGPARQVAFDVAVRWT